jgi:hypothetical protein
MRVIVFFILFSISPLWAFGSYANGIGDDVKYHATGTGKTTGHIVDIDIYNSTTKGINLKLGPYLIPSADTTQGYVVPDLYEVSVPAGGVKKLELTGYCTNPLLPPVQKGGNLKPFSKWVSAAQSPEINTNIEPDSLEGFAPFSPLPSDSMLFCYPGTDRPFLYVIDIDEYPASSARLVVELTTRIVNAYDRLKQEGKIQTPFSGDVLKEAWSIRQQTVWYAVSLLKGTNYSKEVLRSSLIAQYEELTGDKYETMSDHIKKQLEEGINAFWDAIVKVGLEAKVILRNT